MSAKSLYLSKKLIDHAMGKAAFTMPTTVYAALCINPVTPSDTGSTISEATYSGYARAEVEAADLNAAVDHASDLRGLMTNAEDIVWPDVASGSNTVVAVAFLDDETGGNMLYFDTDVGNIEVSVTQTPPTVKSGAMSLTEE